MSHLNCPTCNQGFWMDNWEHIRGSNMALHAPPMKPFDQGWNGPWHQYPGLIPHTHGPMPFPQPINVVGVPNVMAINGRISRPPSPALSTRSRSVYYYYFLVSILIRC